MNCGSILLALLLFCGCARFHPATTTVDVEALALQEERLMQNLTNRLSKTSELLSVLRQIELASAMTTHNIANAQTVAYKKVIPIFQNDAQLVCRRSFEQGFLTQTADKLDLAIVGLGFFQVQMPDGTYAYTRDGAFRVSSNQKIVTSQGFEVTSCHPISSSTTSINISREGLVTYSSPSGDVSFNIHLVNFPAPAELSLSLEGFFIPTIASGNGFLGNPTQDGFGHLMQGYLEMSNVHVVEEVVRLETYKSWKHEVLKALDIKVSDKK